MADTFKVTDKVTEPAREAVRVAEPPRTRPADAVAAPEPASPAPVTVAAGDKGAIDKDAGDSRPDEAKTVDPATPAPKPAEGGEADPFSIDAIELEFARLLGRDSKLKT